MEARVRDGHQVLQGEVMVEPKFPVGTIVTRGRGRPTYRVVHIDGSSEVVLYGVVNVNDERTRPRTTWIAEHNLRKKES